MFFTVSDDFCDCNLPQAEAFCIVALSCEWLFKLLSGATSLYFESRNSFLSVEAPSEICNHKSKFRSNSWFCMIDQVLVLIHQDRKNYV